MRARWFVLFGLAGCEVASVNGTTVGTSAGAGSPSGSNQSFSAEYILSSVQPGPFVPATGFTQKSVIGRCVEIKTNGTLFQEILYSQDAPAALTRETDSWSYTISGTDIFVTDPSGFGAGAVTQRIGSTTGSQISITRTLRNNGLPVIRTLNFSKVGKLTPRCGS
jgi:hypothetical protein